MTPEDQPSCTYWYPARNALAKLHEMRGECETHSLVTCHGGVSYCKDCNVKVGGGSPQGRPSAFIKLEKE